jgi:hypothetical protein
MIDHQERIAHRRAKRECPGPLCSPRYRETVTISLRRDMQFEQVSKILWEVWDPLELRGAALVPDEYDEYVLAILELLSSGATEPEIASVLNKIYVDAIGSGKLTAPVERSARAAKALANLRAD